MIGPDGGTGRRAGLKIRFSQESGSSTLPLGTICLQAGKGGTRVCAGSGMMIEIVSEAESNFAYSHLTCPNGEPIVCGQSDEEASQT